MYSCTPKWYFCAWLEGCFAESSWAINLPSRVAVWFTPGQQVAGSSYRVLNRHAHAWPEVYLSGYGWVAFEPTPGRGEPDAESYTGVNPMAPDGYTPPPAVATPQTPTTVGAAGAAQNQGTTTTTPAQQKSSHGTPARAKALLFLAVIVALLGGAAALGIGRRRRAHNRRRAAAP